MHRLARIQTPPPPAAARSAFGASAVACRGWAAARVALVAALGCIASAGACASDPEPEPVVVPDAGPPCEPGTENCACLGGSGCKDELLCIARRCLPTDGEEQADPTTPSRPRPTAPQPPTDRDAGRVPIEPLDAGVTPERPDASAPEPDASAPEPDADASVLLDASGDPG